MILPVPKLLGTLGYFIRAFYPIEIGSMTENPPHVTIYLFSINNHA